MYGRLKALSKQKHMSARKKHVAQASKSFPKSSPTTALAPKCGISRTLNSVVLVLRNKSFKTQHLGLVDLPDNVLVQILELLDPMSVFRMTLVSKEWKHIVFSNKHNLTKVEYDVTKYKATFPRIKRGSGLCIEKSFACHLIEWFAGISENLESLNLTYSVNYSDISTILKACPKLQHLSLTLINNKVKLHSYQSSHTPLIMPHLISFALVCLTSSSSDNTVPDILIGAPLLQVFRGYLDWTIWERLEMRDSVSKVFSNLLVLQLDSITFDVLKQLSRVERFRLKYFQLNCVECQGWNAYRQAIPIEAREAYHRLLRHMPHLEVLITSPWLGVTDDTIKLIVQMKLKLKSAVLIQSYTSRGQFQNKEKVFEAPCITYSTLKQFQDMLAEQQAALNRLNYVIHVGDPRIKEQCQRDMTRISVRCLNSQSLGLLSYAEVTELTLTEAYNNQTFTP